MSADSSEPSEPRAVASVERASPGAPRPIALDWLAMPLTLLLPARVARWLAGISRRAFIANFTAACIVPPLLLDLLLLWHTARRWRHLAAETGLWQVPYWWAWDEWHHDVLWWRFGPLELIALIGPFVLAAVIAYLAWLYLPFAHGRGSAGRSYCRALRVCSGVLWPACVLLVAGFSAERWLWPDWFRTGDLHVGLAAIGIALLLAWLRRATLAVAPPPAELPPTCEFCGYNLAYLPPAGACPECGRPLADSLDAGRCRPGCHWTQRPRLRHWPRTALSIVLFPGRFYRRLPMHGRVESAAAFARWSALLLWLGTGCWMCGIDMYWLQDILSWGDLIPPFVLGAAVWATIGWLCYRTLAAFVASFWIARRALPDFSRAALVMAYESAFLWAIWAVWITLISSYSAAWGWPHRLATRLGFSSWAWWVLNAEVMLLLVATGLLIVLWLWRYRIARRAVRWANF